MNCDACKNIRVLTRRPCHYCGRLNVEAQLAAAQLRKLNESAPQTAPRTMEDAMDSIDRLISRIDQALAMPVTLAPSRDVREAGR